MAARLDVHRAQGHAGRRERAQRIQGARAPRNARQCQHGPAIADALVDGPRALVDEGPVPVGLGSGFLGVRVPAPLLVPGIWLLSSVVVAEGDDRDRDLMVRDKKRGAEAPLTVSLASRT